MAGRLNIVKMPILHKVVYRFLSNVIPIQILVFFARIEKKNPKIHMESPGSLNNQNNLEKEEQG